MNIQPLSNRVLVEGIEDEAKITKSGIVIPDTVDKKKQGKGIVVAIGLGKINEKGERIPMLIKNGDKVLFKEPWSEESKFEFDGKKLFLVEEDDVLATITD
ncbi:MAG: co-chaperone GroES [Candidatus Paceibacterota bacterium]|jgi:chaperonin GroES